MFKIIITATDNTSQAKTYMEKEEVKKESAEREKYQNVPEKVRKKVGRYALIHGTKPAVDKYSKICPKHNLNTWKTKCKTNKENTLMKKSGKPNFLSDGHHNCNMHCRNSDIKKNGHCNWNKYKFVFSIF